MSQNPQVIELLTDVAGSMIHGERLAGAAGIIPGHLLTEVGATVVVHPTAAGNAQKLFALTNLPIGGTIDDAYADATTVRYGTAHSGQPIYALVAASAAAIVVDDALESAGDGTLRKQVTNATPTAAETNAIVGYAIEAVDNSGGGSIARIRVRVA